MGKDSNVSRSKHVWLPRYLGSCEAAKKGRWLCSEICLNAIDEGVSMYRLQQPFDRPPSPKLKQPLGTTDESLRPFSPSPLGLVGDKLPISSPQCLGECKKAGNNKWRCEGVPETYLVEYSRKTSEAIYLKAIYLKTDISEIPFEEKVSMEAIQCPERPLSKKEKKEAERETIKAIKEALKKSEELKKEGK